MAGKRHRTSSGASAKKPPAPVSKGPAELRSVHRSGPSRQRPVEAEDEVSPELDFDTLVIRKRDVMLAGLLVLFGAGFAFILASTAGDTWVARSEIEYRGRSFVETAAVAASSPTLMAQVAEQTDTPMLDIEDGFTVEHLANSEILRLDMLDTDRDRGLEVLSALTESVVARAGTSGLVQQIELVRAERDRLNTSIEPLSAQVDSILLIDRDSPRARALVEELGVLREQIADLELRLVDLEVRQVEETPIVVTAPYTLTDPAGPSPLRNGLLGAIAGATVAAAVLVFTSRR